MPIAARGLPSRQPNIHLVSQASRILAKSEQTVHSLIPLVFSRGTMTSDVATQRIHGLQATIQPIRAVSMRALLSSFALLVATILTLSINPLLIIHSMDYDKDGDIWWHI